MVEETARVGVGADSRINGGIEGGELLQLRFWKRRAAGRGTERGPAKKGMEKKEVGEISPPSFRKRHRLSVRVDETARVGVGGR